MVSCALEVLEVEGEEDRPNWLVRCKSGANPPADRLARYVTAYREEPQRAPTVMGSSALLISHLLLFCLDCWCQGKLLGI